MDRESQQNRKTTWGLFKYVLERIKVYLIKSNMGKMCGMFLEFDSLTEAYIIQQAHICFHGITLYILLCM